MSDAPKMKIQVSFLQSAKARVFLALGIVVVVVTAIGLVIHIHEHRIAEKASVSVSGGPDIPSVPGAGNPSAAYVQAQSQANTQGAIAARKSATAFVPTITRAGFIGNPDQFGQMTSDSSKPAACGMNKVVVMYKPNPASCTPKNLTLARQTGVTAEELVCQGCSCPVLKVAGYTIGDLKQIGLSATELHACGFDLQTLINAGFSAAELKEAGFTAAALKAAGFSAGELKAAGFSAKNLEAAGYSATQLKNAGFSAADLKAAGFSAAELKSAGFSAKDLKAAGFSNAALSAAGFTQAQIQQADVENLSCNPSKLKQAEISGVSAAALREKGCSLAALKAAGFSARALAAAGFNATELKNAGFDAEQLRGAGFSAVDLKNAGFSAQALKNAGFSAQALKNAGFSAGQLVSAGFSAKALRDAGFSATQLREAGMSASALREAGFSAAALKAAGYTKGDLLRAGFTAQESGYHEASPLSQTAETQPVLNSDANNLSSSNFPSIMGNTPRARLAQFEKQQQEDMNAQQRRDEIERMQSNMSGQANTLLAGWGNFSNQQLQQAPVEQKSTATSTAPASLTSSATGGPTIKAGSILFAVISTSINSDEDTPILAKIVTGQLNGSKLLGTFARKDKKLLITFNVLSDPHFEKSIAINAVAIDPDTARTALSGEVNNHYLLRYGTLFASSFLEGMAQGIVNTGLTAKCLAGDFGCLLQQSPLSPRQQVAVGLGKVGQAYAQHMGENFTVPPTIRIAAGTGIGVLVMGDLNLPANQG